ncbi:MAG: PAS domain S-box protein [Vicinamibacterales bacterium]
MPQSPRDIDERFFTLSIDMLCIADFNGYFIRLNPAWETTLGHTLDELKARPMFEFVHPDDRERTRSQNRDVRAGGHASGFENRYRCRDGSYRWLLWNSRADAERQVIYAVARDITGRKQAEADREALLVELRQALAEVKTLRAILPICSYCKRIRNDDNYWQSVETYLAHHTDAQFTHGICPTCYTTVVEPELNTFGEEP